MSRGFLGWDVGAWHCQDGASRDALVLLGEDGGGEVALTGTPWRGNLRDAYDDAAGEELLAGLLDRVHASGPAPSELFVAIDTPLGWPEAFHALLDGGPAPDVASTKSANSLLMRRTERWLAGLGHRPLSAVQDLIGSQSTKGIAFLRRLGLKNEGAGVWSGQLGSTQVTAIETYPSPCRGSALLSDAGDRLVGAVHEAWAGGRPGATRTALHLDVADALTCALVAWTFAGARDRLAPPPHDLSIREGWIWVPLDSLQPKDASK